jgi:hypothetical protein
MSSACYTQIEPVPWPSGHGEMVAVLTLSPETLGERHDLEFAAGSDNLDAYVAAAVRLGSGRAVGLLRHRGSPAPGAELYVDAGDDYLEAIREFFDCFGLTSGSLDWVREDVPLDHLRLAESARG